MSSYAETATVETIGSLGSSSSSSVPGTNYHSTGGPTGGSDCDPCDLNTSSNTYVYPRDEEERRLRILRSKELHKKANEAAER